MDKKAEGYLFISLPIIIIVTFLIYPILASFIMSFQTKETNVFTLANYKRLLTDDVFVKTLFNTFIFLIIQVPFMLFLGLMIAYILNQKQIKGRSFFTFFFFLPAVTSLVSYSAIFKMMFQINGVINQFLIKVNLIAQPIDWLQTVNGARFVVIVALCWRWTGYNMIFYLSALQQLPVAQFEAAAIDGATKRQQFFHLILPQLKPIILFTSITSTIGTLQLFDEVVNLTNGGPSHATMTVSQLIYNHSFVYGNNFHYAATLSWALVLIISVLSIFQLYGTTDLANKRRIKR